jgi:hypothetical protein
MTTYTVDGHLGGRRRICPRCSHPDTPHPCLFYTRAGKLTMYALACGYVEQKGDLKLHQQHGTYHVIGTTPKGDKVWESRDKLGEARTLLSTLSR